MHKVSPRRRVATRKVFYVPGFDPFPARRYRELFRTESASQEAISGYNITMKSQGADWQTRFQRPKGPVVDTQFEVLQWSDIVQKDMTQNWFFLNWKWCVTAWVYLSKGAFFRLWRLRKGPLVAALYPMGGLLIQNLFMLLVTVLAARGLAHMHPVAGIAALVLPVLIWRFFARVDRKFYVHYLMNDYASVAQRQGAYSTAMKERADQFRQRIEEASAAGFDEVLVIGHSSGAHVAAHALAPLAANQTGRLSFMTLGQVFAMPGVLPASHALRSDLEVLSEGEIPWVDVSSLADGCAFSLCDPVRNLTGSHGQWPHILSARFSETVSKARLKAMRFRYFRIHFQYLCHFDVPKPYDYFAITCGPQSLWRRFHRKAGSPSVKTAYILGG